MDPQHVVEPRITRAKVLTPCPSCGGKIPEDTVWVWQGKFYCDETCCRRAAGLK